MSLQKDLRGTQIPHTRIAIQGEKGSNSHMAAVAMLASPDRALDVVACTLSADVIASVLSGQVDGAVLPIENSLHGSVAEHYDLLLSNPVHVVRESSVRIRHNVIALPGASLSGIRTVFSHPVALSQCRKWLIAHPEILPSPFYDTAGSVKHLVEHHLPDVAAIAPSLAAEVYGAEVLVAGVEDHPENFTRFHLVLRQENADWDDLGPPDKLSLAFAVEHRPGTLVRALQSLAAAGADLTKIESRPVPGRPWEYIFYVDLRFRTPAVAETALSALRPCCSFVKDLGRYRAASNP